MEEVMRKLIPAKLLPNLYKVVLFKDADESRLMDLEVERCPYFM